MSLKGDLPVLAEVKRDPTMVDPNKPETSAVDEKPKLDPIGNSIKQRLAAGTLTSTVSEAKSNEKVEIFKLSLKGDLPVLAEIKYDPAMFDPNKPVTSQSTVKSKPCEIDLSLKSRLDAGTITSQVPDPSKK